MRRQRECKGSSVRTLARPVWEKGVGRQEQAHHHCVPGTGTHTPFDERKCKRTREVKVTHSTCKGQSQSWLPWARRPRPAPLTMGHSPPWPTTGSVFITNAPLNPHSTSQGLNVHVLQHSGRVTATAIVSGGGTTRAHSALPPRRDATEPPRSACRHLEPRLPATHSALTLGRGCFPIPQCVVALGTEPLHHVPNPF